MLPPVGRTMNCSHPSSINNFSFGGRSGKGFPLRWGPPTDRAAESRPDLAQMWATSSLESASSRASLHVQLQETPPCESHVWRHGALYNGSLDHRNTHTCLPAACLAKHTHLMTCSASSQTHCSCGTLFKHTWRNTNFFHLQILRCIADINALLVINIQRSLLTGQFHPLWPLFLVPIFLQLSSFRYSSSWKNSL